MSDFKLGEILDIGGWFEIVVVWLADNFKVVFDLIHVIINSMVQGLEFVLLLAHPIIVIILFTILALYIAKRNVAIFTFIGMYLIYSMSLWNATMSTLALVISSVFISLVMGIPLGILAGKKDFVEKAIRPILDFMQTLPVFVYLIPAVLFFRLGEVPGVVATLIFALPPVVRLTSLGIRQVPIEIKEAAESFGASPSQILFKTELPVALPTILAGMNQTIMLALSMVVIAGMIGAGGLGSKVMRAISEFKIDLGFESGLATVILAIFLDRITLALGIASQNNK